MYVCVCVALVVRGHGGGDCDCDGDGDGITGRNERYLRQGVSACASV